MSSQSPAYPKRLIEVDLPIARISAHARREKSIRHGHISTLHIWWARRPLAACRAVICAALWPDPADELCPPRFRDDAFRVLADLRKRVSEGGISPDRTAADAPVSRITEPKDKADLIGLRKALLDFIAEFANWDLSTNTFFLEASRALTQSAHEALGGEPGNRPLVVDPFAGGGSIPLEALRVGADAFASDLNPVAALLNKVVLEFIPKYGQTLANEVRKWGDWIQEQVENELGQLYPVDSAGMTPLAYLWTRTIISEAPDDQEHPVEVPLMRSMWLAKRSSNDRALRWVRDSSGHVMTDVVEIPQADGVARTVRRPRLEIFAPRKGDDVEQGTVSRGAATCPVTGYTTPVVSVRRQLKCRRGGASDARLIAVRITDTNDKERTYREPLYIDAEAAYSAKTSLSELRDSMHGALSIVPDEPTPLGGGSGAGRAFSQRHYGMDQFIDLFTPRQSVALATFARRIQDAGRKTLENSKDAGLADAVQACLSLSFGRLADFCSSLCVLNATGNRGCKSTFTRQALPIIWDFMETNPLNRVGANWLGGIETLEATIRAQAALGTSGHAQQSSATSHPLPSEAASGFITDPPYYDAVPYSDLSDYFFVWLKRALPASILNQGFDQQLTPKGDECIVDEVKGKDKAYFEKTMASAMAEGRRVLSPSGIGIVVFAHKSTSGWESQLQAMINAGWIITGSWPIDTERPGRLRAQASAALASSVHLVCRPRENPDGSLRTDEIGDWRDVLAALPKRIHDWMPRLAAEGVVGADAIFACLGPALEIFSRYSRVEKSNGDVVPLREYLEHVWAAVSNEALSMIFKDADAAGLEPDARLTAMWLWTLGASPAVNGDGRAEEGDDEDDPAEDEGKPAKISGFVLEFDAARKIAQGLGVHLEKVPSVVEVKGDKACLLPVAERTRHLFGKDSDEPAGSKKRPRRKEAQLSLFAALKEADEAEGVDTPELKAPAAGITVLDRVHQAMILFAAGRGEAIKRFLVEDGVGKDGKFWKLAQSLSALYPPGTDEKRWVDGVLARKKGLGL